jgi:hypothetical protein
MARIIDAALFYASRGLPVIPCWSTLQVIDGDVQLRCGCRRTCTSPGKHPIGHLVPHGHNDATLDPARVGQWWTAAPEANIGIAVPPGHVVIDVDPDHGGIETLSDLEKQHEPLPTTWRAISGGGGQHHWFTTDVEISNGVGALGAGIDIRSTGGYVIAPPSRHISGRRYSWDPAGRPSQVPIAPLPAWVADALHQHGQHHITPTSVWRELVRDGVREGARNQTIARLAGHLLRRYIDPIVTLDLIHVWNAARCRPPLDTDEVSTIIASIAEREMDRRGEA